MIRNEYWDESLPLLSLPRFKCPSCDTGHFVVVKDSLHSFQTSQSRHEYDVIGDVDTIRSRFIAMSVCDNPNCNEPLAISGLTKLHPVSIDDDEIMFYEDYPGPHVKYVEDYTITYLSAPIAIINVPHGIGAKLQELLDYAFLIFWSESHTCANKLRQVLEYLLNEKLKVSKKGSWVMKCGFHKCPQETKKRELSLDQQIEKFIKEEGKSTLGKYFKALRVLGNSGSHITESKIDRSELIKAFRILESLLDDIYKDNSQIEEWSEEIIQKRNGK